MKKIILILLVFVSISMQAQTANGTETKQNAFRSLNPQTVTSANFLTTMGTDGTMGKITPANLPVSTLTQISIDGKVSDTIRDGITTIAPSENAVFDALELKQDSLNKTNLGQIIDGLVYKLTPMDGDGFLMRDVLTGEAVEVPFSTVQPRLGYTPENQSNKTTDFSTVNNTLYPSVQAVKTELDLKAPISSPTFTGTVTAPTISTSQATTATAFTQYFGNTGDNVIKPKTLANVKTEIVTTQSVFDAAVVASSGANSVLKYTGLTSTSGTFDSSTTVPTALNRLNLSSRLYVSALNVSSSSTGVLGTTPTHFLVMENANADVRPRTISNIRTDIVTTASVDAAKPNIATTISPALTGTPTAPTATAGTNTTQIATTAFVQSAAGNMQTIYDNSTSPQIITTTTDGALVIKRGSAVDTDNILVGQNGAGSNTFTLKGNGNIAGSDIAGSTISAFNVIVNNRIQLGANDYIAYEGSTSGNIFKATSTGWESGVAIRYDSDLSGTYTDRSLIDRGYSDKNRLKSYTVATLPASPSQGDSYAVTDALAPSYLVTVVGGGTIYAPVIWNGSAWVSH